MKHWQLERDAQGIAWLTFDQGGSAVNTLGAETLAELEEAVAACLTDPPAGLAIRTGKPVGFCAGADLRAFAGLTDQQAAADLIRRAQGLLDRLEGLPCPSVALIQGHCLGGGLELALACTYRVAADDPGTRLGFPEVQVGIFPGFGGTLRAPRAIGHLAALRLMLDGRPVSARAALDLGLVDARVAPRLLREAALDLIARRPPRYRPPLRERAAAWPGVRPLVAVRLRRLAKRHADPGHYPAPLALVDHWARHAPDPKALLAGEAETVPRLLAGVTAQNLVRVFLLREGLRAAAGGPAPPMVPGTAPETAPDIRHLHLIGAGVMGGDIAAWAALRGLRVSLQDRRPEDLTRALGRAEDLFRRKLRDPRAAHAARDRLIPDARGDGLARADLVLEAIIEDVAAKRALFAAVEPRLKPGAWLATNTSSIPLETLAAGLARPGRLVGLHFFNPVARMPLVEVVRGASTDESAVAAAEILSQRLDKLPLVVKSGPGFLVNRILMPYLLEAVTLVDEGVPPARVDRAATAYGLPMGPVELADTVGLDICLAVARGLAGASADQPPSSLIERVESGRLGRKSGEGYYRWEDGHIRRHGSAASSMDAGPFDPEHQDRLILRLLNESVACLREEVVPGADALDAGLIFGAGFPPFRGGPLHDLTGRGAGEPLSRLQALHQRLGERFRPDPGWALLTGEQPC